MKIFFGDIVCGHNIMRQRHEAMIKSYDIMNKAIKKWERQDVPNNKLKMSGKPMKRRGV